MAIAASALSLIRSVFNRDKVVPQPYQATAQAQAHMSAFGGYASYLSGMTTGGPNEKLSESTNLAQDLQSRYQDYLDMNSYPECGIALNIYADEATQKDSISDKSVWVESPQQEVVEILEHLLHKQLEIEEDLWSMARQIAHKGNLFQEIVVYDGVGVVKLLEHPQEEMRRVADKLGTDYGFIQDEDRSFSMSTDEFLRKLYSEEEPLDPTERSQTIVKVYEPWEVSHFRLRTNTNTVSSLYGESVLEPARWVWKRIQMMEDAMVLYKVTRSPQRYVFYVDVGDIPPNEAKKEIQKVKNEFKKQKMVDPATGQMGFQYQPLAVDEDFFISKRNEKRSSEIELLSGLDGQQVDDTNYFREKLFSALGVPKTYLGADDTIGRANLGQMDVRFAKAIMRLQRALKNGIRQICDVDLASRNIDPAKVEYQLKMVIPSGALEIAQIEVERAKVELAQQYQQMNFPDWFVWTKILGLSDDEALEIQKMRELAGGGDQSMGPDGEGVGPSLESRMLRQFDSINKKHLQHQGQIIDMMERKNGILGRRLNELRGLSYELKRAMR